MKLTVIIVLTFGLISCNNSANKKTVDNEKDSLAHIDTFYIDENEVNSNEYKEYHQCDFNKLLNNPKTPQLAKDIYLGKEWDLSNDTEALSLLDSLTAKDKTSRPFYFKVVTLSKKKSDGYYSEGLGHAGYNYVIKNTQEFASYFDNKECFNQKDLETWAKIVLLEFHIIQENVETTKEEHLIYGFCRKLISKSENFPIGQKRTIEKFTIQLKKEWGDFLKNI